MEAMEVSIDGSAQTVHIERGQAAIYKTAVFSLGLIAGSAKPQLVQRSRKALWTIFTPSCLYIFYVCFNR
jgi:hypothetical protein